MVSMLSESIRTIFKQMDLDGNSQITKKEFLTMQDDKKVMKALEDLDINEATFQKFALLMFKKMPDDPPDVERTIMYDDLMTMLLKLRPGNQISALEFANFRHNLKTDTSSLQARTKRIERVVH